MNNIPQSLQRIGIETVSDNLPANARIDLPAGYIWGFFGTELKTVLSGREGSSNEHASNTAIDT